LLKSISLGETSIAPKSVIKLAVPLAVFAGLLLMPTPEGLTPPGQRALAVMALAVLLWATEALPIAVAGIGGVILLVLTGAVPNIEAGVYGFSQPVVYFLIGILTLGLAVHQSGLAERMATFLIRGAVGSPRWLYVQMLFSFAALAFALPSAGTRGAIMVHVYEQVLAHWNVPPEHALYKALMMAMGSLNRLGSTALLAGGITPVVASGLLGDFSWTQWFLLMGIPFYANLVVGGTLLYFFYRSGFRLGDSLGAGKLDPGPVKPVEIRAGAIALLTALLWFTDFAHGLHPAVPALIAMGLILTPGIGILSWQEFERNLGWSNFFVIATSLSLAHALVTSGAAGLVLRHSGGQRGRFTRPTYDIAVGLVRLLRVGAHAGAQHRWIPGTGDSGGDGRRHDPGPESAGLRNGRGSGGRLGSLSSRRRHLGGFHFPAGPDQLPGGVPLRPGDDRGSDSRVVPLGAALLGSGRPAAGEVD